MATILWVLCLMHALHTGLGHGLRRIGRSKRLALRAFSGVLLACLPFLALWERELPHELYSCWSPPPAFPPPTPPVVPPPNPPLAPQGSIYPLWAYFPHVASRTLFLMLFSLILLLQLAIELYGRGYAGSAADDHRRAVHQMRVNQCDLDAIQTRGHTKSSAQNPAMSPRLAVDSRHSSPSFSTEARIRGSSIGKSSRFNFKAGEMQLMPLADGESDQVQESI